VSQKNVTTFSCYNFDEHELILKIFGRNVTENVGNQKMLYLPHHLTNASALPEETENPEIASFLLNAACCFFYQRTREHIKNIILSQFKHSSLSK